MGIQSTVVVTGREQRPDAMLPCQACIGLGQIPQRHLLSPMTLQASFLNVGLSRGPLEWLAESGKT